MSDQIAPSLAGELEQAAERMRIGVVGRTGPIIADTVRITSQEMSELLTRAAALARAVESFTTAFDKGRSYKRELDELRALVSSEGKGE